MSLENKSNVQVARLSIANKFIDSCRKEFLFYTMGMSASMQKIQSWVSNLFTLASLPIIGFGIGWLLGLSISPVVSIVITSVTGVAAAVITVMSGLEGKLSGLIVSSEQQISVSSSKIDSRPRAALIIGLFLGSIVGIQARNHNWLGTDLSAGLKQWTITGLTEQEIARRLFELKYPYTPYAEDISWIKIDASSGITTALASEIDMWNELGIEREEVVRRLFEIKYPLHSGLFMTTTSGTKLSVPVFTVPNGIETTTVLFSNDKGVQTKCEQFSQIPNNQLSEEMGQSENVVFKALSKGIESPDMLRQVVDILCELTQA